MRRNTNGLLKAWSTYYLEYNAKAGARYILSCSNDVIQQCLMKNFKKNKTARTRAKS